MADMKHVTNITQASAPPEMENGGSQSSWYVWADDKTVNLLKLIHKTSTVTNNTLFPSLFPSFDTFPLHPRLL